MKCFKKKNDLVIYFLLNNTSKLSLYLRLEFAFVRNNSKCRSFKYIFNSMGRLHFMGRQNRAASRAITGCLSSSPIPFLLSEASLPPLRVTLIHFTLLSYERALCLPTSFPISGLARLGEKPRLCRSSWRAFASTHPLMLPSTCSREALVACPPSPPWNLPSFTVESTLPTPCSRSDPPLSRQGAALAHLDSLPPS